MKETNRIIILIALTVIQIFANIGYYKNICNNEEMAKRTNPKKFLKVSLVFVILLILEIIWLILMLTGVIS